MRVPLADCSCDLSPFSSARSVTCFVLVYVTIDLAVDIDLDVDNRLYIDISVHTIDYDI